MGMKDVRTDERLDAIVSLSTDLLFEYEISTDTMYYLNQEYEKKSVTNHYTAQLLKNILIYEDDSDGIIRFCEYLRRGEREFEIKIRKKFGEETYRMISVSAKTLYDQDGIPQSVVGKSRLGSEELRSQKYANFNAEKDSLTGLYTEEYIKTLINNRISKKEGIKKSYLMVMDFVEYCSSFNKLGTMFSNILLCIFADELRRQFPLSYIGRIGEYEFVLYLENMSLLCIKEQIKRMMNLVQRIYEKDLSNQTQIGITSMQDKLSYDEILLCAQSALVRGKGKEKGKVQIYRKGVTPLLDEVNLSPIRESAHGLLESTDEDIVIFAVALFDKVKQVQDALRILLDIVCRFYRVQEIVYFTKKNDEPLKMQYYWGSIIKGELHEVALDSRGAEWDTLLNGYDEDGISILYQIDTRKDNKGSGKSIFGVHRKDGDMDSYLVFVDWENVRDWKKERVGLKRLAWLIHKKIKKLESEREELTYTTYLTEHDEKTDLYNYTKFLSVAEQLVKRQGTKKYALIYSDFSNFQFLNETYGYATGDKVLIEFSQVLKERCSQGVLYGRVTGDHFISMHEYCEKNDLVSEYTKICDDFCREINNKYKRCNLILVSGICIIDNPKMKIAVYVDNANMARKIAKKHNRTRCEVYFENMRQISTREMEITGNMEEALDKGEFVMYLQPQIDLCTGKIAGAEALVRWIKEDGTMLCPDEFIPLFEKNGFVTKIDFEILRQVLALQKQFLKEGKKIFPISVNFSRRHQENDEYVERIHHMIRECDLPSDCVEIEVTESVFMGDFNVLNHNIGRLKQKGFYVAIDDFGSGYSSLNILSKVNADLIKLDREFLMSLEVNSGEVKKNFLKTLVLMIKQLGFKVLAEGVETKEQEEFIRSTGCEYAQGYLYAKPMCVSDYLDFVKEYENKKP